MDIKTKIEEIVNKIQKDPKLMDKFQKNPTGAIEELIGVDLPDDQINGIVNGVKAKINMDGIAGKLGSIFGKK